MKIQLESAKQPYFVPEPMPHGRVLVVDDVTSTLAVIAAMLEPYELSLDTCDSGEIAIDKIKQGNVYDVILMDQMMPDLDGMETMLILRDMGYMHPIVAFTANDLAGELEKLIKAGFDSFVSKPIDLMQLNEVLVRYIKPRGME